MKWVLSTRKKDFGGPIRHFRLLNLPNEKATHDGNAKLSRARQTSSPSKKQRAISSWQCKKISRSFRSSSCNSTTETSKLGHLSSPPQHHQHSFATKQALCLGPAPFLAINTHSCPRPLHQWPVSRPRQSWRRSRSSLAICCVGVTSFRDDETRRLTRIITAVGAALNMFEYVSTPIHLSAYGIYCGGKCSEF